MQAHLGSQSLVLTEVTKQAGVSGTLGEGAAAPPAAGNCLLLSGDTSLEREPPGTLKRRHTLRSSQQTEEEVSEPWGENCHPKLHTPVGAFWRNLRTPCPQLGHL